MPTSPAPRAGSRERMLEATIELLRGGGLSAAGINDIVRASAAPKGSVYHHFPGGKLQIAGEALEAYAERVRVFIGQALASRETAPDKVRALFDAFARRVAEGGFLSSCAVGTVSLDLDEATAPLRAVLADATARWQAEIASHFDLGSHARTQAFAGLLLTAIEGGYVRCRAEASARPLREAGEWLAALAA